MSGWRWWDAWDEARRATEIAARLETGMGMTAIARELGISAGTAKKYAALTPAAARRVVEGIGASLGAAEEAAVEAMPEPALPAVPPPPRRSGPAATPDADILAVVELWAEGRSYKEIAAALGITHPLVTWRLRIADERGYKAAAAEKRAAVLVADGERARLRSAPEAVEARMAEVVRRVNAGQSDAVIEAETGFDTLAIRASIVSAMTRHIPVARREPTRVVKDYSGHLAVALMRAGKSNAEVAAELGLTKGQVAGLRDRAFRKGQVAPGPRVSRRPAPSRPSGGGIEPTAKGLTETEIAAVAEAWNGGKGYDEIGAALGLTSNQVRYRMTAARRAGLVLRAAWPSTRAQAASGKVAGREPGRKPVATPKPPAFGPRGLPEIEAPIPVVLAADDGPPAPGRYTVLDRLGGRCRWVADVLAEPGRHGLTHMFCGEPVSRPGGSWCAHHHAIAWRPRPLPSERAAGKVDGRVA
jgi:DNA-binding CsgD family transcriptional regulator